MMVNNMVEMLQVKVRQLLSRIEVILMVSWVEAVGLVYCCIEYCFNLFLFQIEDYVQEVRVDLNSFSGQVQYFWDEVVSKEDVDKVVESVNFMVQKVNFLVCDFVQVFVMGQIDQKFMLLHEILQCELLGLGGLIVDGCFVVGLGYMFMLL